MTRGGNDEDRRLDDAARAGWLYYVAGNTQDEIAAKLGISRQSAQRLVSLAISAGLVKVRLEHPIAQCLDLATRLRDRFALSLVEVAPTDPASDSTTLGVANAVAVEIERHLKSSSPIVMAMGTGRTLKAAIDLLPAIDASKHKIVSLTGTITPDGSAAFYNVIYDMASAVRSRLFPMPLPVIASSRRERDLLHQQPMIQTTLKLAARANVAFVGIGDLGARAPLFVDGFITGKELRALQKAGGVGEIVGWTFDERGEMVADVTYDRVTSAQIPSRDRSLVIAGAKGKLKLPGIVAALRGRLINGLITDEATARAVLGRK
ncbi:sugar-binding transcriptional regulator [Bradyrhizobium sp.]|uniref:sugar-binding transcriptional regulator n=1 Tax=Bradyrhizobium sp. TaxID=376 RepID=UPI003C739473